MHGFVFPAPWGATSEWCTLGGTGGTGGKGCEWFAVSTNLLQRKETISQPPGLVVWMADL